MFGSSQLCRSGAQGLFGLAVGGVLVLLLAGAPASAQADIYDLTPFAVSTPDMAHAEALWVNGNHSAAVAALEALAESTSHQDEAAAYWLRLGDWLRDAGRPDGALSAYAASAAFDPLAGPAHLRAATIHERRGAFEDALRSLGEVPPGGPAYVEARLRAARLLLRTRRTDDAMHAAREAAVDGANNAESAEASLLQAQIAFASGQDDLGTSILWGMWWRDDEGAKRALAALDSRDIEPDAVDRLLRDLIHLKSSLDAKGERRLRALVRKLKRKVRGIEPLAEALLLRPKRKERTSAAQAAEAALDGLRRSDRLYPWALWTAAETVRRLDRDLDAVRYYTQLADGFPAHPFAAAARYEAGELLNAQGLPVEAEAQLRALLEAHPNADDTAAATWELGWGAYLAGDGARAERYFQQLLRKHGARRTRSRAFYGEKALYWLARSRENRGERERAAEAYRDLMGRYPLTYYSTLAQGRLVGMGRGGVLGPPQQGDACSEAMAFPLKVGIQKNGALDTAAALHRLGYTEEAWDELVHRLQSGSLPQEGLLFLLGLCHLRQHGGCTDWLLRAYGRIGPLPGPETEELWRNAYPIKYEQEAATVAEANGMQPQLVLALIRHESGFNPRAKSYAGAYGLMQLLPSVASEVARALLHEPAPKIRDLFDADTNVRLGARYLREILSLYDGNVALALAAYNAGPYAVKRWLERQGHLASDEFVEVMPYKGAKAYAKKVLTTYAVYRYLYCAGPPDGGPAFTLAPRLPDRLGDFMVPDDEAAAASPPQGSVRK